MADEAREAALAAWLGPRVTHWPRDHAFRAGYDAARAECERKMEDLEVSNLVNRNAVRLQKERAGVAEVLMREAIEGERNQRDRAEKAEARVREQAIQLANMLIRAKDAESALATECERNAKLSAELENVKAGRDAHKAAGDEHYDELQKVRAELDQLRKDYAAVKAAWEGRG